VQWRAKMVTYYTKVFAPESSFRKRLVKSYLKDFLPSDSLIQPSKNEIFHCSEYFEIETHSFKFRMTNIHRQLRIQEPLVGVI